MRKFKKSVCVLLSVLTLLCALTITSCAAERAKTYLVLGDSIGVGAGIQNPKEANYGRIIANTNGFIYYNDAVNGHTSAKLLSRMAEKDVIGHIKEADIISVTIGGNDFLKGNLPALAAQGLVGNYGAIDDVVENVRQNFDTAIATIRRYNKDAVILMQTLYNPIESAPLLGNVYAEGISRLNAVFTDYAENHPGEIEIVDVAAAFAGKSGLIAVDTIHPNAEGNLLIAKTVQEKLYALGLAETAEITVEVQPDNWVETGNGSSILERIVKFFRNLAIRLRRITF